MGAMQDVAGLSSSLRHCLRAYSVDLEPVYITIFEGKYHMNHQK